jgi:hypothetical protein
MAIVESSLYADLYVETSPVQTTAAWTNHIATVRDINVTRGGEEPYIGVSGVQPGAGTISLVDNTATINPGYWVRVRYQSTIIWAGFVQDVNITYGLVNGEAYAVKTLTVLDWAAWISQYTVTDLANVTRYYDRLTAINTALPGTPIKTRTPGGIPPAFDILDDLSGTYNVAEALDITANSLNTANAYWRSLLAVPTGSGSGIADLVDFYTVLTTLNVALTDGTHTGTPTNLTPYTDVIMATKTSQVANTVIITGLYGDGGSTTYQREDTTSVSTYGARLAEYEANPALISGIYSENRNLFPYPSFENYLNRTEDTNFYYSAEQPALDSAGAWTAYDRDWAYRAYCKTTAVPTVALPLSEVVEVTPGKTYYGFAYGAASAGLNSRARFFIQWQNDAQGIISTTYGAYTNHTALKTWYKSSASAVAPAGAVYARVGLQFSRTTGANIGALSKYWTDGLFFGLFNATTYFDGDTPDTTTGLYFWGGTPDASVSYAAANDLYTLANQFLTDNKDPKYSPYQIRLNAQANLTAAQLLDTYSTVYFWYGGHRWTAVITGMSHEITINQNGTTRWVIELIVRPSAYTI